MSAIGRPGKTTTNVESRDAAVGAGRRIVLLLVLLAGLLVAAAPARAGVVQVTTRADETSPGDGSCSLREAISAVNSPGASSDCANTGGGANVIVLGPGRYVLSLPGADESSNATGDLNVAGTETNLTIQGAGASATTIDATGLGDRVLNIAAGATVAVSGLTISGGHAPPGATGAPTVPGSPGEAGGGILNQGSLTLTGVVVTGNQAGAGGSVQLSNSADIGGGRGGDGGGIENLGTLELVGGSVVSNNRAGDAGNVKDGFGSGGAGGDGGGIHNTGKLTLTDSTVSGNVAGSGGSSGPAVNSVGDGGAGGNGGAIYSSAAVTLSDSTINANSAGAGGHGGDSDDGGHSGGPGGNGGGVYSGFLSSLSASNTTLAGNLAGAGGDGGLGSPFDMTDGGPGGPGGSGGAIETTIGAFASLTNVTVADNTTASGGAGGHGFHDGTPGNAGGGGGVSDQNSACLGVCTRLQNAIVAHNSGGNCAGPITDGGENLVFGDNSCPGVQVDPRLGPLHDNGGPTETIALHVGSAAVDLAPPGPSCPPTDQRGVARSAGRGL